MPGGALIKATCAGNVKYLTGINWPSILMLKTSTFRENHQSKSDYMDRAYDYWGQQAYQYDF